MKTAASGPAWTQAVIDEAALGRLAARFAELVWSPMVIFLQGDLGAGKTTFARAFIHALGFNGHVKSPSYGLLETYAVGGRVILHLDLYRIEDAEELEFLALRDLFDDRAILLVEWPERGAEHLPAPDVVLQFDENDESRFVSCRAESGPGAELARLTVVAD